MQKCICWLIIIYNYFEQTICFDGMQIISAQDDNSSLI